MQGIILLPVNILMFWYLEAPLALLKYFFSFNKAFLSLFSLPLMIRTFFRPFKNEYRKEFVKFSIFMGMVFKTIIIAGDIVMFLGLILVEVFAFAAFLAWPLAIFYLPFIKF